jgi:hypothetical protein
LLHASHLRQHWVEARDTELYAISH